MPSLPPVSWITTRTRLSRTGGAARAAGARKPGTDEPRASRADEFRKARREYMRVLREGSRVMGPPGRSGELGFRGGQDQDDGAASGVGRESRPRAEGADQQFLPGGSGNVAEQQFAQEGDGVFQVIPPAVPSGQPQRVQRAIPTHGLTLRQRRRVVATPDDRA